MRDFYASGEATGGKMQCFSFTVPKVMLDANF